MTIAVRGHREGQPQRPFRERSGKINLLVGGLVACAVAVAVVVVIRYRGGGSGPGSGAAAGHDSPQAVFEAHKQAMARKDWKTMVSLLTPEAQDLMVGQMAMGAVGAAQSNPDVDGLCKRHGIDPALVRKQWSEADGKRSKSPPSAGEMKEMKEMAMQRWKELAASIRDKPAFSGKMMAVLEKLQAEASAKRGGPALPDTSVFADATLTELKIEGDAAKGMGSLTVEGKTMTSPITFQRVEGKWYLSMPEGGAP